jgi:hypothetical protein
MKSKITLAISALMLVLSSCGESKTEMITPENIIGKVFVDVEKRGYLYFFNDKEVLQGNIKDDLHLKHTYKFSENKLTINYTAVDAEKSRKRTMLLQDNFLIDFGSSETFFERYADYDAGMRFDNLYSLGDFSQISK